MSNITVQMMKRHRWSLVGPACTQVLAAAVISVMAMALTSLSQAVGSTALTREPLVGVSDMMNVLRVDAGLISVLVVGITMNLAAGQQMQDLSLLRAIGATPSQMRRCITRQALLIAIPSSMLGFIFALPVTDFWLASLRSGGIVPQNVEFIPGTPALITATIVVTITSTVGTTLALVRRSRRTPARAIIATATAAGSSSIGWFRGSLGALLLVASIGVSVVLSSQSASTANAGGLGVVLASSVAVGLLGPALVGLMSKVAGAFARHGVFRLAVEELAVMTRPLAGALVPMVIAVSFALIQNGMLSTAAHVAGIANASERVMTLAGTLTTTAFAAVAALNCLITVMVSRRRETAVIRLVGASKATILKMRIIQAVLFSGTALTLSGVVSLITLIPIVHTEYEVWLPWYRPGDLLGWAGAILGVVACGMIVAPWLAMRSNPTEVARVEI